MRTKEEIFKTMRNEMPWKVIGEEKLKPYILEAMQIYAEEYHKAQANEAKTSDESDEPSCSTCVDDVDGTCLNNEPCVNFDLWMQRGLG
jgi:hypothetical protein